MPASKEQLDYLGFVVDKDGIHQKWIKLKQLTYVNSYNKRDNQVFLGLSVLLPIYS